MVTAKRVIWTEAARNDLYQIYQRVAGRSQAQAQTLIEHILPAVAELEKTYPQGQMEPLLKNEREPHRYLVVGFYKIIYSVSDEQVIIKTLYHERQDPVV